MGKTAVLWILGLFGLLILVIYQNCSDIHLKPLTTKQTQITEPQGSSAGWFVIPLLDCNTQGYCNSLVGTFSDQDNTLISGVSLFHQTSASPAIVNNNNPMIVDLGDVNGTRKIVAFQNIQNGNYVTKMFLLNLDVSTGVLTIATEIQGAPGETGNYHSRPFLWKDCNSDGIKDWVYYSYFNQQSNFICRSSIDGQLLSQTAFTDNQYYFTNLAIDENGDFAGETAVLKAANGSVTYKLLSSLTLDIPNSLATITTPNQNPTFWPLFMNRDLDANNISDVVYFPKGNSSAPILFKNRNNLAVNILTIQPPANYKFSDERAFFVEDVLGDSSYEIIALAVNINNDLTTQNILIYNRNAQLIKTLNYTQLLSYLNVSGGYIFDITSLKNYSGKQKMIVSFSNDIQFINLETEQIEKGVSLSRGNYRTYLPTGALKSHRDNPTMFFVPAGTRGIASMEIKEDSVWAHVISKIVDSLPNLITW